MKLILAELLILLALLVANGVFAMTEIAVVSARKSRLRRLADEGSARARAALALAESPTRFLSTVQIGITLVGILAGAFGGATFAAMLTEAFQNVAFLAPYAAFLALAIVVLTITFLSLVIGELVPKRIGLNNPERIAILMARPMHRLSALVGPVVWLLSTATESGLRLLGVRAEPAARVTDDEVKALMQEGLRAGAFEKVESELVSGVLDLDQLRVRDLMTPRTKIMYLNSEEPHEAIWHKIVVSNHSYFPVYQGNRDNVVGVVSVKAIYANLAAGAAVRLRDLLTKPLIVPATQSASRLLETFKLRRNHTALVTDEFGSIVGLVTLRDVMEAILGEMPSQDERARPTAHQRADGTWLIDGMMEVAGLQSILPEVRLGDEDSRDYQTLAGFVVKSLGHVPKEGETFESQGFVFEVLDMDRHRVDKVLVMRADQAPLAPEVQI
ncbi:MAG: hemolysin family protein [Verrucomicrobia bacterium]|jgi:putative hemolysin|nr:hemolysin family protein [Verrucomicrobiota bacterium]